MSVLESFNASIASLVDDNQLDAVKQGPAIEAARKLAQMMDGPDWPMVNGKLDNVSPGVFLKYCDALGIVGADIKPKVGKPKVTTIVGNSKWAKGRAVNE